MQNCSLKLHDLTAKEQIGIIDSTLACVVSWLEGHSLAQTVFTNLYLHKPHQIEDRPMKAFSIAILKIIEVIRSFVTKYEIRFLFEMFSLLMRYSFRAMVFEEEDFQPVMYGYRLVPDVTDTRALGMLREVEDELGKKMKTLKSTILSQNPKDHRLLSQVYI
jgi:N-alpha-acetyltransferase 35, NatC auxiliary subunit